MAIIVLRGTLVLVGPTEQKTDKFSVAKFILETDDGPIEIQLINKSIEFFLKSRNVGDKIGVNVEVQGRMSNYNGKDTYFTTMHCVNTFPIFTRGDEAPGRSPGVGYGASNNGGNNSYGGAPSNNGYGQTPVPPAPEDDLPF